MQVSDCEHTIGDINWIFIVFVQSVEEDNRAWVSHAFNNA